MEWIKSNCPYWLVQPTQCLPLPLGPLISTQNAKQAGAASQKKNNVVADSQGESWSGLCQGCECNIPDL